MGDVWLHPRHIWGRISRPPPRSCEKKSSQTRELSGPKAAQQLKDNTYVDDSILGGSKADVQRMRGEKINGAYTGTVPQILAKGAMAVKFMAVTGSDDAEEELQLGGKTLGVPYRIREDKIFFKVQPFFYCGQPSSSDAIREAMLMSKHDIEMLQSGSLAFTRRHALSMVMGVFDPMGLVSPALMRGKLLLRRLYNPEIKAGWDSDLPLGEKKFWADWFNTLLHSVEVEFPRSTRPENGIGVPALAGFCDASDVGVCASLYVLWKCSDGETSSRLLMAKCRVAPIHGMTIPRGELKSLTILH